MQKITWVLMNIDNAQIKKIKNKIIENGEIRRTINYLLDKNVNFTISSKYHSSFISKRIKDFFIPNKKTYAITSYGCEIYSFKRKKVISRSIIDMRKIKELSNILKRIDFDFCQKIFVEITEKNGLIYIWNNKYKYFKNKIDEFLKDNGDMQFEIIDDVNKYHNFLYLSITFLDDVNLKKMISFLTTLNNNFSYKIVDKNKIIITSKEADIGVCMDTINKKYLKLDKSNIMSFSDSISDIPIFKRSAVSITIDRAPDDLKKIATNVFVGVEDMYINEFLKKEIKD